MDKIFVVVPVYNVEAFLEGCIESILKQTYDNYRLILVDDGSTDNSSRICDIYEEKYEHITTIHQENAGPSSARNAGINYALKERKGDQNWITFVDSDDYIHPQYLEYMLKAARENEVDISCCEYVRVTENNPHHSENIKYECNVVTPEKFWFKDRTNAMIIATKLYRFRCFETIRFPEGFVHEDELTTYKVLFETDKIAVIPIQMYYYVFNNTSITHKEWNPKRLVALTALKEQIEYFRENGYSIACKVSIRDYLQHSIKHLMFIKALSPKYDGLIGKVKEKRAEAFKLYREEFGIKQTLVYWFQIRINNPLKRVLQNESVFSFLRRRLVKKLFKR